MRRLGDGDLKGMEAGAAGGHLGRSKPVVFTISSWAPNEAASGLLRLASLIFATGAWSSSSSSSSEDDADSTDTLSGGGGGADDELCSKRRLALATGAKSS